MLFENLKYLSQKCYLNIRIKYITLSLYFIKLFPVCLFWRENRLVTSHLKKKIKVVWNPFNCEHIQYIIDITT